MIEPEPFRIGEMVRIKRGAFAAFTGRVKEVKKAERKLKVEVVLFIVKAPVEVKFSDVEKVFFA